MKTILNIEIKARCPNLERIKKVLETQGADFKGADHQVDTYFKVPHGRLKLRQGKIENSLIYYERKNQKGPKRSLIVLYETNIDSVTNLKEILSKILGVLTEVDKEREIYFIGNIKLHIDKVKQLGNFVEIEVKKIRGINQDELFKQCQLYLRLLNIPDQDLVSLSYSDMIKKIQN